MHQQVATPHPAFQPRTLDDYSNFDSHYWRARDEYLKLVNEYAGEHNSLRIGRAYADAWLDELFPDGVADLTWEQIYWDLKTHREHPPECDCNGHNNPLGCAECRVSARVNSY